jgi:hypothetical protein
MSKSLAVIAVGLFAVWYFFIGRKGNASIGDLRKSPNPSPWARPQNVPNQVAPNNSFGNAAVAIGTQWGNTLLNNWLKPNGNQNSDGQLEYSPTDYEDTNASSEDTYNV